MDIGGSKMTIEDLQARAKELGIDFDDETSEDDLQSLIDGKEEEIAEAERKKEEEDNDIEYWKSEAKKVITQRDTAKKDSRALKSKVKKLESQLSDLPDPDTVNALKEQLNSLKEFKDTIEKEKEEEELAKKSEIEKMKVRNEKEVERIHGEYGEKMKEFEEKFNKVVEDLESTKKETHTLRHTKLESEIVNEAAKLNAFYPQQVYLLMKDNFEWDNDLGRFIMPIRDDKGKLADEKDVKAAVNDFLKDPNNENLVKSNVNKTGMYSRDTDTIKKGAGTKRGGYDPKDEELIKEAEFKGLEVEDLIDIKIKRDKKLGLTKKNKDEE